MAKVSKLFLFDIDHTLSDAAWRDHMIATNTWDEYHTQSQHDNPIKHMREFVNIFAGSEFEPVGCTLREEKFRGLTNKWLYTHDIKLSTLLMRPNGNRQTAGDAKLTIVENHLGPNWQEHIAFIIDDNEKVINAFAAHGINTLHFRCK